MKTSKDFQREAEEFWLHSKEKHGYDDSAKWPFMCGSMSVTAEAAVREASNIQLADTDHVEVSYRTITIYEKGKRSQPKGSVSLNSHFMYKKFLRTLLEDWFGEDTDWNITTLESVFDGD